jgi:hypothetical protein
VAEDLGDLVHRHATAPRVRRTGVFCALIHRAAHADAVRSAVPLFFGGRAPSTVRPSYPLRSGIVALLRWHRVCFVRSSSAFGAAAHAPQARECQANGRLGSPAPGTCPSGGGIRDMAQRGAPRGGPLQLRACLRPAPSKR